MKPKTLVLMAVAVGCGLVAMFSVQKMNANTGPQIETVDVLHVLQEVAPGVPLDETNTAFKTIPKTELIEGMVTTPEEYEERAPKSRLFAGQRVMIGMLGEKGARGAAIEIPPGMRVVTVPVDLTMVHGGLLQPNDQVDLFVTYKANTENGPEQRTRMFLKRVKVFAADSIRDAAETDGANIKAKNISLLVTPKQAGMVMLAKSKGSLTLAMRPPGEEDDDSDESFEELTDEVFGDGSANRIASGNDERGDAPWMTRGDGEPSEPVASVPTPLGADADVGEESEPLVETWKINIFDGDQLRVEYVELPGQENGSDNLTAVPRSMLDGGTTANAGQPTQTNVNNPAADPNADPFAPGGEIDQQLEEMKAAEEDLERLKEAIDRLNQTNLPGN